MQVTDVVQYVEFGIDDETYALKILEIQEIIRIQEMTEIPNCRFYVKGIINLRGKLVPVISLRLLLDFEEAEFTKASRIIIVGHNEEAVGIIVDRVNKVTTFQDIHPPPVRIGGINGSYVKAIGVSKSGLVGILKLDEVLLH